MENYIEARDLSRLYGDDVGSMEMEWRVGFKRSLSYLERAKFSSQVPHFSEGVS